MLVETQARELGRPKTAPVGSSQFRPDIQGIRAVAVLTVILYHASMPGVRGGFIGVDVFFVISGFLITGGIVKELRRDGTVSLSGFYVRRIARILPAATVTIIATVLLARVLLPLTRWRQIGEDAAASSLYVVNWMFARNSVDYVHLDQAPSPMQHFWSLAVEEQYYIVWPLLLLVIGWIALRLHARQQPLLLLAVGLVAVPSLIWSIRYTAQSPSQAYFVTTTRMWELAVGAGLAIASQGRPRSWLLRSLVGWAGLAAVITATVLYTDATSFPGYTALLPVLGAAAMIWSGPGAGPARLLSLPPMVWIGGISYSLYLWHWPLLVVIGGAEGTLSRRVQLAIVLGAMLPAWLSTRFIEKPAQRFVLNFRGRRSHRVPKLALGSAFTAIGVICSVLLVQAVPSSHVGPVHGPIGAEVLAAGGKVLVVDSFPTLLPAVTEAAKDLPAANKDGCMLDHATTAPKVCSYGALQSSKVIALVGDSHAAMLIPGLAMVAERAGYRLDTYTKGSCPPVAIPIDYKGHRYAECAEWTSNVIAKLARDKPALAITAMSHTYKVSGSHASFEDNRQAIAEGLAAQWDTLRTAGVSVAGVRDIPHFAFVVPDCIAKNMHHLSACARSQKDTIWDEDQTTLAAKSRPGVAILDFTGSLCGNGECPAVIDKVIVYRDTNHLTATFCRTMQKQIADQVLPLLR